MPEKEATYTKKAERSAILLPCHICRCLDKNKQHFVIIIGIASVIGKWTIIDVRISIYDSKVVLIAWSFGRMPAFKVKIYIGNSGSQALA